jgi:hypothetical protein
MKNKRKLQSKKKHIQTQMHVLLFVSKLKYS